MATTLQNLRDTVYDILREEEDVSAYPLSLVDLVLNTAQQKICFGRVVNPLTKEEVRKGSLPFLQTESFYSTVADTSTSAVALTGAVTIDAVNTSYPTTGSLYIQGDIVTYTGASGTQFTGVTGLSMDIASGTAISAVYTLPTNFASSINITYDHRYKLECKQYDDVFEDLNSNKGKYLSRGRMYENTMKDVPFYSIKDNQYIVLYNISQNDKTLRLRYEKTPTTMSSGSDTATISNDLYAKSTIAYLAVGELLYNRGEEARAAELLNFAIGQVREMYSYYNDSSTEKISGTQYKIGKGKMNI